MLPFNWVIEWDRFVEHDPRFPDHFSRKVDTRLADALGKMVNQSEDETDPRIKAILEQLAVRNLLRGYQLSMPTGQAVAAQLSLAPLSEEEIQDGNSDELNQHLTDSGFLQKTPLWYYVLKEAEVQSQGNSLGELGSRIVAGTLIGQLRNDPSSYLAQDDTWVPEDGVLLPNGLADPDDQGLLPVRRGAPDAALTIVPDQPFRVPRVGTRNGSGRQPL